jgi:2-polyprenyl-3-methyl-5-hydroxy-6-metoxy-1,4-benzoquinol methylase
MTSKHRTILSVAAYDEQWSKLSDFIKHNPGSRHRRRLIAKEVGQLDIPIRSVLDVGCGIGELIMDLSSALPKARFVGLDISPIAIETCRQTLPNAAFHVVDIANDHLNDAFDLVVCSEVTEHLENPMAAVSNLRRMTRLGGYLVLTTPHGRVHETEESVGHIQHPTRSEIMYWLEMAGFSAVRIRQWGWPGYLVLKYLVNLAPRIAVDQLASTNYGAAKILLNKLAYTAANWSSFPSTPWGPQFTVTAQAVSTP